ncbi:AAA family ATPase [Streptomyces sp. NPDC056437]|uniref:AAA family ATPase n=1 Tax=Streptomyces sp. NPDC056437 TaxID=3345816 RepID=UPI0036AFE61A
MNAPKPTVHLMQGLPASGKTTIARRLVATGGGRLRRVSLDDLRHMLDSTGRETPWEPERETSTVRAQAQMVRLLAGDGYDVVVDNTHLYPKQVLPVVHALRGLPVEWRVHHRISVPLEVCLARDADRQKPVGRDVILRLHERWLEALADGWSLTTGWLRETHLNQTAGVAR